MFSVVAAAVQELCAHREMLVIGSVCSWSYQCITFMDNLELINQGMEGGVGFAFPSCSCAFSFHFHSNSNSSHNAQQVLLEQLEYRYGLGEGGRDKCF